MTNLLVKRVAKNELGRDFIVGDIHGHFSKLAMELDSIGFSADKGDRLFSVGDLVDRGPESLAALDFLKQPFVHAVAGNHEDMAIRWPNGNMGADIYAANGGAWMIALDRETQCEVAATLSALPVAIELETENGLIGIVHAECPFDSWQDFTAALEAPDLSNQKRERIIDAAQWSRGRINGGLMGYITGVRAVIVGHTPMSNSITLGNTIYIDTMGWRGGKFTIMNAETLVPEYAK